MGALCMDVELESALRFEITNSPLELIWQEEAGLLAGRLGKTVYGAVWKLSGPKYVGGALLSDGKCIAFMDHAYPDLEGMKQLAKLLAIHIAIRISDGLME